MPGEFVVDEEFNHQVKIYNKFYQVKVNQWKIFIFTALTY
jgi:hypothetical protein